MTFIAGKLLPLSVERLASLATKLPKIVP